MRPTPDDYTTVCRRLVEKHSCLKDRPFPHYVCKVLYTSMHCLLIFQIYMHVQGSWKRKLRMKFRNLRRPARAHKAGIVVPPPAKKKKEEGPLGSPCFTASSLSDMAEYDQHVNHIKKIYTSQKWSIATMSQLLQETATERRRWIREDCPSVKEVLLKFPCLHEPKLVSSLCSTQIQYTYMCTPSTHVDAIFSTCRY